MFYEAYNLSKKIFFDVIEWPALRFGSQVQLALPIIVFFSPVTFPIAIVASVLMFPVFLARCGFSKLASFFNSRNKTSPQEGDSGKMPVHEDKTNPLSRLFRACVHALIPKKSYYIVNRDLSSILGNLTSAVHQRSYPKLEEREGGRVLPCLRMVTEQFSACRIKHLEKNGEVLIKLVASGHYEVSFKGKNMAFFTAPSPKKSDGPFYFARVTDKEMLGRVLQGLAQTRYWSSFESEKDIEKDSARAAEITQEAKLYSLPPSVSEFMQIMSGEKTRARAPVFFSPVQSFQSEKGAALSP